MTSKQRFAWQDTSRMDESPLHRRRTQGLPLYPQDRLFQEMSFLGYYLHWSKEELLNMPHWERRRWCSEVSAINKKLSGTDKNTFEFR
jgi:hypothetical protein